MKTRTRSTFLAALTAAALGAGATAQTAVPVATLTTTASTVNGTADIAQVSQMLSGSWRSTSPVALWGDSDEAAHIVMHVAPVEIKNVENAHYVEAAREDSPWEPYRQSIYSLYTYKGKTRLRTYEIRNEPGLRPILVGGWLVPSLLGELTRDDLIATLDVELTASGGGYAGRTPYPYPTGVGGAVEMTSETTITRDRLTTIDRGYNADGKVVWGSDAGSQYTFARYESPVSRSVLEGKVIAIDFNSPDGHAITEGDTVAVHYTGWLPDGSQFDSSRSEGRQPLQFTHPGRLIQGWITGMDGLALGARRRLIIPPEQGYGERGFPPRIPGNATLVFEIEIMHIQEPTEAVAPGGEEKPE